MRSLSQILSDTPKDIVQAYMIWKTIQAYVSKVQDPVLKPLERFNNQLQGKDPDATEERWRTCIRVTDNGLGWILSRFFVEKAFSPEAKEFGDLIVSDIKDRFKATLKNTEWMSKDVRDKGIEKVKNIVQKIGYPTKSPDIMDPEGLRSYYEPVKITNHTFFENAVRIQQFYAEKEWSALGKPTDRDEWLMTAPTVNAYYNPPGNEIVFPAGIMQSPVFYDPSVPQYLSYGAFGAVSGHELSHGESIYGVKFFVQLI
jgi:endothelin-converting enzyme